MDCVAELGWPGVLGNTDEVLWDTSGLKRMQTTAPKLAPLLRIIEECAAATRKLIGDERLNGLRNLPREIRNEDLVLVHASPGDLWKAPMDNADEDSLEAVYGPLHARTVIYGHIHRPFVKTLRGFTVCNSGSVGMPYDGDPRACYLLLDDGRPTIRRIEYDVNKEVQALLRSDYPFKEWLAEVRVKGAYVAPPEQEVATSS